MEKMTQPISLAEFKKQRTPVRDVNQEFAQTMSVLDRFALVITDKVGTIGFFLVIFVWTVFWMSWNILAPKDLQFDAPMGFVIWLFISNLIQILLMPLIMVGQNLQGRHAENRAQNDLEVNIKAEQEIEAVLHHLEYQNAILIAMMNKLNIKWDEIIDTTKPEK